MDDIDSALSTALNTYARYITRKRGEERAAVATLFELRVPSNSRYMRQSGRVWITVALRFQSKRIDLISRSIKLSDSYVEFVVS